MGLDSRREVFDKETRLRRDARGSPDVMPSSLTMG